MTDLHTRLVAALTARLDRARAATPGPWTCDPTQYGDPYVEAADGETVAAFTHAYPEGPIPLTPPDAEYIAANAPDVEIRRVEATLRVVQRHAPEVVTYPGGAQNTECHECGHAYPCQDVRDISAGEGIEP